MIKRWWLLPRELAATAAGTGPSSGEEARNRCRCGSAADYGARTSKDDKHALRTSKDEKHALRTSKEADKKTVVPKRDAT